MHVITSSVIASVIEFTRIRLGRAGMEGDGVDNGGDGVDTSLVYMLAML